MGSRLLLVDCRVLMNREYLHLCSIPMFHAYGFTAFACGLLGSGSPIVVLSKFDVMEMLRAVEKYRVTDLRIVPPILLVLTRQTLQVNLI